MNCSKLWTPSPVSTLPLVGKRRRPASALWERPTATGQRRSPGTNPELCPLRLGRICPCSPWWSRLSERMFRSEQVCMRPAYKAAPLWVPPHWGKGTFWIISVPKPTLLNRALFPREFLIETSLAICDVLLQWLVRLINVVKGEETASPLRLSNQIQGTSISKKKHIPKMEKDIKAGR